MSAPFTAENQQRFLLAVRKAFEQMNTCDADAIPADLAAAAAGARTEAEKAATLRAIHEAAAAAQQTVTPAVFDPKTHVALRAEKVLRPVMASALAELLTGAPTFVQSANGHSYMIFQKTLLSALRQTLKKARCAERKNLERLSQEGASLGKRMLGSTVNMIISAGTGNYEALSRAFADFNSTEGAIMNLVRATLVSGLASNGVPTIGPGMDGRLEFVQTLAQINMLTADDSVDPVVYTGDAADPLVQKLTELGYISFVTADDGTGAVRVTNVVEV